MDYLVPCPCGHALAAHDDGGCSGERLRPCISRRDRAGALEGAILSVRTKAYGPLADRSETSETLQGGI